MAEAVRQACESVGFFTITAHGVPEELSSRLRCDSLSFFDLPLEEKQKVQKPAGSDYKGYTAKGQRTTGRALNKALKPSLVESIAIGMPDVPDEPYFHAPGAGTEFYPNRYPSEPRRFEGSIRQYYAAMRVLSGTLMRIFAQILDVPPAYFLEKLDKQISILRVNHYMALAAPPAPGEERSGLHTDTGAFTILKIDEVGGLQVKGGEDTWIDVEHVPEAFVINIGDTLMRWTNDRWKSTLHRVVTPLSPQGTAPRRISVPFFCQPNYDAVIECIPSCCSPDAPPRYAPITSGEILMARHVSSYMLDQTKSEKALSV